MPTLHLLRSLWISAPAWPNQRYNFRMASRIVKALKSAKSSLRSQDVAREEPEIVAVNPPPQDPKRSQPPPTPPAAKQHAPPPPPLPPVVQQPSPPLSPVAQQLEDTRLTERSVPEFSLFLAELPDTSITRPKSPAERKETNEAPTSPIEQVREGESAKGNATIAQEHRSDPGLGKELKDKKKKDPAVLVEIPKSPSAQAYEVAHHYKLQDQYFNPVFEDESRTPKEGAGSPAPPSPEKVVETLKAMVVDPPAAS